MIYADSKTIIQINRSLERRNTGSEVESVIDKSVDDALENLEREKLMMNVCPEVNIEGRKFYEQMIRKQRADSSSLAR